MRRKAFDDCWGVRWTVRATYDRYLSLDSDDDRRKREPELRSWLGPALAPQPGRLPVVPVPAWAPSCDADYYRFVHAATALIGLSGPGGVIRAILHGVRLLRQPTAAAWTVVLQARGRIRRGATWRAGSRAEAESVLEIVAEAVSLGRIPQPAGTLLIDVVDERLTMYGAVR